MAKPVVPVLTYQDRNPPFGPLAAAKITGTTLETKPDPKLAKDAAPALVFPSGDEFSGVAHILRYLARSSTSSNLYGSDATTAGQVDQWLEFAPSLVAGATLEAACASINEYLSMRTYLAGYSPSIADLACWGQLQGTPMWDKLRKSGSYPHLGRWYDNLNADATLAEVADQFSTRRKPAAKADGAGSTAVENGKGGGNTGSFDIDLPGAAEGKVVTRFPPEPSGYLHIGHAKAALLNQHFANLYKGKLIVRFDDTNPSKEKDEFVENILSDIGALGIKYDTLTYTSDYFPQMFDLAERLIRAGHMYADDTPVEQMREERMHGIESKHRNRPAEESLAVWKEMVAGSEEGLKNCMRFKMDMQALNKALRDPVAYRCNLAHHWRTGTRYKVYPTYDCACPFVDSLEGVTHALRTSEYKDREAQYYRILEMQQAVWPGLPRVHLWDFSRLSFVYTVLSKRKLTWFVNEGRVTGWDDPRFPTVQGMLRRGLQLEALREFILSQGASKNVTFQEWDKIWTINKRIIDPVCPRHTAIQVAGRVLLHLTNAPREAEVVIYPRHKKYPPAGEKATTRSQDIWLEQADAQAVSEGEEVTLMDWGNCFIRKISRDESGQVTALEGELHLEGSVKATKLKLTWLSGAAELVELVLVDLGYLITKRKLEEDDRFEDFVNPQSRFETPAVGDANMRTLQQGEVLQLERKGYYIVDQTPVRPGKPLVLLNIPDGRAKPAAK